MKMNISGKNLEMPFQKIMLLAKKNTQNYQQLENRGFFKYSEDNNHENERIQAQNLSEIQTKSEAIKTDDSSEIECKNSIKTLSQKNFSENKKGFQRQDGLLQQLKKLLKERKNDQIRYFKEKTIISFILCNEFKLTYKLFSTLCRSLEENTSFDQYFFKILVQSTIRDLVKAIQSYLKAEFKINFQPLSKSAFTFLYSVLINPRQKLSEENCETLVQFARKELVVKPFTIQPFSVVHLYHALSKIAYKSRIFRQKDQVTIQKSLKSPKKAQIITKSHKERLIGEGVVKINQQWNQIYEKHLIATYKENQSFTLIKENFCKVFPNQNKMWQKDALKARFFRIIRKILRELRVRLNQLKCKDLPNLMPLQSHMIQLILRRQRYRNLRIALLRLNDDQLNQDEMMNLVRALNKYNASQTQIFNAKKGVKEQEEKNEK